MSQTDTHDRPTLLLRSPNGDQGITIDSGPDGGKYSISFRGYSVIRDSRLGLETERRLFDGPWTLSSVEPVAETDTVWQPVHGERANIRNHYHETVVHFTVENPAPSEAQYGTPAAWRICVRVRAYDEGIAFRYEIPAQVAIAHITTLADRTEFRFADDWPVWVTREAQGKYGRMSTLEFGGRIERPCIAEGSEFATAVAEAQLVDFARMQLEPLGDGAGLRASLDGWSVNRLPFASSWRVVMNADAATGLLANNDIFLNLNAPCAIADTSWIRPGKLLRDVSLSMEGACRCIDFAAENGLQYIMWDAGWYGPERSDASDATTATVDEKKQAQGGGAGPLDVARVAEYGKSKGIGLFLYVNHRVMEKQLDQVLPLFRKWGVAGVKFGFVRVGSQEWTECLHDAVRAAADHRLLVNIHDEYRPTGYRRTYPNLLNVEGVHGDECTPDNATTLAHLFNRWLCGPADQTFCYFSPRVGSRMATHAGQLAKGVLCYSPLPSLFWYDRPARPGWAPGTEDGLNGIIGNEPELEWWKALPASWDDTRILGGDTERYLVVARRSGSCWWVGFLNAGEQRTYPLKLDFLDKDETYNARVYVDDPSVQTRTQVRIDDKMVSSASVLDLAAGPTGGVGVRLSPA